MKRRPTVVILAALLSAGACGYTNDPVSTEHALEHGSFTASVNGIVFEAAALEATFRDGVVSIAAGDAHDRHITLTLTALDPNGFALPKTIPLTPATVETSGFARYDEIYNGVAAVYYSSAATNGSATVTITAFDQTKIAGTFQFALARQGTFPTPGVVHVTLGEFSVTF
jgi:hypothetical protein